MADRVRRPTRRRGAAGAAEVEAAGRGVPLSRAGRARVQPFGTRQKKYAH